MYKILFIDKFNLFQQADIGVGSVGMSSERAEIVDFTDTYYIEALTYGAPFPKYKYFINILKIFDKYVWLLIFISILLLAITLSIIKRLTTINIKFITYWTLIIILLKN